MPTPHSLLHVPQPCSESWAAMTPASGGRHCAACQKTVVDFTLKTDAEILAYFQKAGAAIPCGRFRTSQLARPLWPAALVRPAQRWRKWVAAALAIWGLRAEATRAPSAGALPPSAQHPRRQRLPATATRQVARRLVSGVVRDYYSLAPVAHAKVKLQGGHRSVTTDAKGHFQLWLPARRGPHTHLTLVVQQASYETQAVRIPLAAHAARALRIKLAPDIPPVMPDEFATTSGVPMMQEMLTVEPQAAVTTPATRLVAPAQPPHRIWYQRITQLFRRRPAAR